MGGKGDDGLATSDERSPSTTGGNGVLRTGHIPEKTKAKAAKQGEKGKKKRAGGIIVEAGCG